MDLKQDRRRMQSFSDGESPQGDFVCTICGTPLYECMETTESHFMACHGFIEMDGKRQPCPNNIDKHDPSKHWKPKADFVAANWHKWFVNPEMINNALLSLSRPVRGRKVV